MRKDRVLFTDAEVRFIKSIVAYICAYKLLKENGKFTQDPFGQLKCEEKFFKPWFLQ